MLNYVTYVKIVLMHYSSMFTLLKIIIIIIIQQRLIMIFSIMLFYQLSLYEKHVYYIKFPTTT